MDSSKPSLTFDDMWNILESTKKHISFENCSSEMIFLIGKTRCGKTALLKILGSEKSNFSDLRTVGEPPRIVDTNDEIGNASGSSCTRYSKCVSVPHSKSSKSIVFVDTPGEGDNRGPLQEIAAVHSLNLVANQTERLKFLLRIPFRVFYSDENKKDRLEPFEFAMQFLRHVSTLDSIGVVVTKVENHSPWDQDSFVIGKVLSSLKALKIHESSSVLQTSEFSVVSLIESVIRRKHIMLVRRPTKPTETASINLAAIFHNSQHNDRPYYRSVCEEVFNLCENLKFAQKESKFAVTPGSDTKLVLREQIFPSVAQHVLALIRVLTRPLLEQIEVLCLRVEIYDKLETLSRVTDALQNIAEFLKNRVQFPSKIIVTVANVFESSILKEQIELLRSLEEKIDHVQEISERFHEIDFSLGVIDFKQELERLKTSIIVQSGGTIKIDLEAWIQNELQSQVNNIRAKYFQRYSF